MHCNRGILQWRDVALTCDIHFSKLFDCHFAKPVSNCTFAYHPMVESNSIAKFVSQYNDSVIDLRCSLFIIGRRDSSDCVLAHKRISGHHAQLEFVSGRWRVRDLRSRNGIRVNGRRLSQGERHELQSDDFVCIADLEYVFIANPFVTGEQAS